MRSRVPTGIAIAVTVAVAVVGIAGCFEVRSADLFQLTRVGPQGQLTMVVSDGGTIRCNGHAARAIPGATLVTARDLADDLDKDAKAGLHLPVPGGSVTTYSVRLQDGTVTFADRDAAARPELGRAVLFALQAAQGPCKGSV